MLITLLLIAFVSLWGISFVLFDRDLVSPAMLLISGYTVSVGFAFISSFFFPFNYHTETVFVLLVGTLLFVIPAYAVKEVLKSDNLSVNLTVARSVIVFRPWVLYLAAALIAGAIVLSVLTYCRILKDIIPGITYTAAISAMRNYLIVHPEAATLKELLILNQVKKIFLIGGWFLLFVYARNCAVRRHFLKDRGILLNLVLILILIGTGGGRGGLVAFILGGAGLFFFFDYLYNGTRLRISLNLFAKLIGGGIATAIIFFGLLCLTGRRAGTFDMNALWTHVQIYLAGPIPLLDHFLQVPYPGGGDLFGRETFYALNSQLSKLHLIAAPLYSPHLEFRPGVYLGGNCYTAYRSYLYDFGYAGLILCPILFSVMANVFYYTCVKCAKIRIFAPLLILYATVMYSIFIDFERSCFFTYWLSFGIVVYLVGFVLLYWFLLKLGWMKIVSERDGRPTL